jgi:signal transduction histidine kinase
MRFRLWPRTLPFQLVVVVAGTVALSNIGVAFYYYKNSEAQARHDVNQHMIDRAASVAAAVSLVQPEARLVVMRTMSRYYWRFREVPRSANVPSMTAEEQALARNLEDALPVGHPGKTGTIILLHRSLKTIAPNLQPVRARDNGVPDDAIQTIIPISTHSAVSGVLVRPTPDWPGEIMVAAVIALLLSSLGAALIARRMVRPLSELTRAASTMAAGIGSGRPHVAEEGPADVRDAAAAFNAMAEKVTRTLESQRHLLSAVGHDLRTPITAMRINLEFVSDEDLREGLRRNLEELQALTEQVLASARGTGGEAKRNVDLSALVESLCADLEDMDKPVFWMGHPPAPIFCRPNEIRRAVRNLVENAVAYGGKANVQIINTNTAYEILVEDEGPGIPESDHQRVFEAFVRLEGSRNLATGGTGLGLTLVKAVVEGHDGTVTLENRPEGGLRVRMRLPRMGGAV